MNKLLSLFGLMKISRAKKITSKLHLHYVQCVINGVEKDFGKKAEINALQDAGKWWNEQFEWIMQFDTDDVVIPNRPNFMVAKKLKQPVEADAEGRCPKCNAIVDDGKCWDCIGDGGSRTA